MKHILAACAASLALTGTAFADASTFVEVGYIIGGENGQDANNANVNNNSGERQGLEVAGAFAIDEMWYIGGVLGRYDRDDINTENTYLAINGGAVIEMTDKTDLFGEAALWLGDQDNPGGTPDTDPRAIEAKVGVTTAVTDKFSLFGTISLVAADLDRPTNDSLRNFVWSAGGAYAFTDLFSLNLKIVEGSNGVNGQTDIARLGFRFSF